MVYARRSRAKYPSAAPSCVSWQGVPNKSPWDVRCHHQPTCKLFKAYWLSRFFLVDQRNLSSCLVGTIFSLRFQPCFVGCGVGKSGLTCSVATIYDDVRCSTYSCISHCAMTCMWTVSQSIKQINHCQFLCRKFVYINMPVISCHIIQQNSLHLVLAIMIGRMVFIGNWDVHWPAPEKVDNLIWPRCPLYSVVLY